MKQNSNNRNECKKTIKKMIDMIPQIKSKNCSIILLKMILKCCKEELIDLTYLINLLISLINSNKSNSKYCIDSITQLMVSYPEYFIKTYSTQNPSHPFIAILRNSNKLNTNLHEFIYHQIEFIFKFSDLSLKQVTALLKPVLIEIFFDSSFYKHLVVKILLDKINSMKNEPDHFFFELYNLLELYFSCLNDTDFERPFFKQSLDEILYLVLNSDSITLNKKFNLKILTNLMVKLDYFCDFDLKNEWKILIDSTKPVIDLNIHL
jgi:hypothetical protein